MSAEDPATGDRRWQRIERLVGDALALPDAERGAFLDRECGTDAELRREVESLLELAPRAEGFLEPPRLAPGADLGGGGGPGADPWFGRRIGSFELRTLLGAGGMGRVYEAWQDPPGRSAAVKIVNALVASSDRWRFEFEASILARLRHPNIAHLYGRLISMNAAGS